MRRQDESDARVRALNRFGLGARVGEADRIGEPREWLLNQIGRAETAPVGEAPVTSREIGDALAARNRVVAGARNADDAEERRMDVQRAQRQLREIARREMSWALTERVATPRPFVERLVAFWSNHLCVSIAAKPLQVGPLAGLYEREAIRPHVLGKFENMVLASARHPAMLFYLDNAQSIGEGSEAGRLARRRGVTRGLNENYARELLELHTLGVDGGYTQEDVIELARILTGWSVAGTGRIGPRLLGRGNDAGESDIPEFRFYPALHEPGARTVLGKRYRDGGEDQGTAVIGDLCRHRSTATFVATKLVRHFVSDQPEAEEIDTVASVFRDTGGDLKEVSRALVHLDRAWDRDVRKFRTPQDWLVAGLRALGAPRFPDRLVQALNPLRQPLWSPPSPKGYGDTQADWADPDSLMNRAELARTLSGPGRPSSVRPRALAATIENGESLPLMAYLEDASIDSAERLALAIGGPDFQWR